MLKMLEIQKNNYETTIIQSDLPVVVIIWGAG